MRKIICLFLLGHLILSAYAQTSSRAINTAGACIINIKDTACYHFQSTKPVIKIKVDAGDGYTSVIKKLGYPNSKIAGLMDNKEKWIYDTLCVYFKNQIVDIMVKRK